MMSTDYIAFDGRSGRIISVYVGVENAEGLSERAQSHPEGGTSIVKLIPLPPHAVEQGKTYKVDVERGELVEAPPDEGVSFSYGSTAQIESSQ